MSEREMRFSEMFEHFCNIRDTVAVAGKSMNFPNNNNYNKENS